MLAFHIRGQNAGLVVRKQHDYVSFESFELSPVTSAVMGTKGRLRRSFPGPAIALEPQRLKDPLFCGALAQLLAKLDTDTPLEAMPVAKKAGNNPDEVRDTVHPQFVTEMLTGFLRGIGRTLDVVRFHKATRDDVLWNNVLKPWRRSPLWLLVRVALQATLMKNGNDHTRYKHFIIFFMAEILRDVVHSQFASDIIFVISAKISRRALKLDLAETSNWYTNVEKIMMDAHYSLEKRWKLLQENPDPLSLSSSWKPSELCFREDTSLSLSKLKPYLASIATRPNLCQENTEFNPVCRSRFLDEICLPQGCLSDTGNDLDSRLSVLDVERWVKSSLENWLRITPAPPTSCASLASLLRDYIMTSSIVYKDDPIDVSMMLLTSMELWVALDKLTTARFPKLKDYCPGFPVGLFDPMLLPQKIEMTRLAHVEQYLEQRRTPRTYKSSLFFENCNEKDSFAVQYYQQSTRHQDLHQEIEKAATIERQAKIEEYEEKTRQHQGLMQTYASMVCEEQSRWNHYLKQDEWTHSTSCSKCDIKRQADAINIFVHEWPLPKNPLEAEAAVFELEIPVEIFEWRELTYTLLVDVFSPQKSLGLSSNNSGLYYLHGYDGLNRHFQGRTGRLQFASTSKPFLVAHYRSKHITAATKSNICVNNGLSYNIYDSKLCEWTPELLNQCDVQRICTFQLPSGPFAHLQFMVDGTNHTSNEALAKQSDCPRSLTLHEFYSFATLRAGHRLQWLNLARVVASRTLRFNQTETHLLVIQAVWQVGCVGSNQTYRDSHLDLGELEFGLSFMSALDKALGIIEGNWQGAVSLRTFIVLAIRVLSMSPHQLVHQACYSFLRRTRGVAMVWIRDVGRLCHKEEDETALKALGMRALELGLICHSAFDVDQDHLPTLLNTSEDVSNVTECCVVIHDRSPAITDNLSQPILTLLRRFERTSHFLEPFLRAQILNQREGIDKTLGLVWSGYQSGSSWSALATPNERWLVTKTSDRDGYSPKTVHYNLLDGTLLVNGLPLTRLPRSYEAHPTYRRFLKEVSCFTPSCFFPGSTKKSGITEDIGRRSIHNGGNVI